MREKGTAQAEVWDEFEEDEASPWTGLQHVCGRGVRGNTVGVGWGGLWRSHMPAWKFGLNYTGIGSRQRF